MANGVKFILLLGLGVLVAYLILKSHRRRVERSRATRPPKGSEDMVRCEHCGVHLPRSESITTHGRFFCTPEHRREHDD